MGTRLLDELRRSGVHTSILSDAAAYLSAGAFAQLYRTVIEQLEAQVARDDGHAPTRKQDVDLMCRCVISCNTLGDAIQCAAQFCAMLHPRAGELSLTLQGKTAVFHMDSLRRRHSSAACLVDLTGVFCYLQLFSWLIGEPLLPIRVFLAHPHREDAVPFLSLFDVPVVVGQLTYGFAFDAEMLARSVRRQPSELAAFLKDFPFRLTGARQVAAVSLAQQVRSFMDAALARRVSLPTLTELAGALSISKATLRRRLQSEGSGYRALREGCLLEAARYYLRSTDWSIERIAGQLGFSSAAAMRRAFVRLTGNPPTRYRYEAVEPEASGSFNRTP